MSFFGFVLKGLLRRPFRTFLTLVALATAIGSVMALTGVADGFTESFRSVYETHRVDVVVSRQGSADRLSSSLGQEFSERVAEVEGVERAAGVLLETLSIEEQQVYGIPAMGLQADSWLFADYGLPPAPDVQGDSVVYLGQNLADRVGAKIGQNVSLFDETFEIVGIFQSGSVWENGSMIMPLAALQGLTGREDQLTYINVVLAESVDRSRINEVLQRIEAVDPKLLPLATDEFVETDARMQLAGSMAWMTSAIALLVGAIGTLNTMMTSVLERTGEIGILRAIGWSKRRVAVIVFMESIVLALAATLVGGVAAAALLAALSSTESAVGVLQPSVAPGVWLRGAAIGLGIGAVGALLPAYRAVRLHPTEALRHQG